VEGRAMGPESDRDRVWTRNDSLAALGWFALAWVARSFLLARVEGILDHDQAIVGLMALDISEGTRWPIFFDGQRYMGALEAYTAAVFVKLFGHSPVTVAMAPTFYFALFVAGQYAAWRCWSGRATGHLAAVFTVACSPMLTVWSIIPRGGYPEVLAWGLVTLAVYRRVTRADRPTLGRLAQFGWGVLFTLGYFINPLSLVVYVTMAVDWTFGRHGADLRLDRGLEGGWPESRWFLPRWIALAAGIVTLLALGCHVDTTSGPGDRYIFFLSLLPEPAGRIMGVMVVIATLAVSAWWTGAARRIFRTLASHPRFALGALCGLSPFLVYNIRVRLGLAPVEASLPIWIRAPWTIGSNLFYGISAVGPLFGGQARAGEVPYLCLPLFRLPDVAWPEVSLGLRMMTPVVVVLLLGLIATAIRRDRAEYRRLALLLGDMPTSPTILALTGLACTAGLYLFQATSVDGSSIRYLLPAAIFLPGLLATGAMAWPKQLRIAALAMLLATWSLGQANLAAEMSGPNVERELALRLETEGVNAIVANGALVQVVADLSHGRVGGLEYRSRWPRIRDRYAARFRTEDPVVCVVDLDRRDDPADDEPGRRILGFVSKEPGRAHLVAEVAHYQVWRLDTTLAEFLEEPGSHLPGLPPSAIVAR
jgi:hypothetical protein